MVLAPESGVDDSTDRGQGSDGNREPPARLLVLGFMIVAVEVFAVDADDGNTEDELEEAKNEDNDDNRQADGAGDWC